MQIKMRTIVFKLHWADGRTKEIKQNVFGDNDEVQWVCEGFKLENGCSKVEAFEGDRHVASDS